MFSEASVSHSVHRGEGVCLGRGVFTQEDLPGGRVCLQKGLPTGGGLYPVGLPTGGRPTRGVCIQGGGVCIQRDGSAPRGSVPPP